MADFNFHIYKRQRTRAQGKWRDLFSVVFVAVLIIVIISGFINGIKVKGIFSSAIWDGFSPLAIVLNSNPVAVVIYQQEPKRISILKIPGDISFATGDVSKPVMSVSEALSTNSEGGRKFLTKYLGAKIPGYVLLKAPINLKEKSEKDIFADFAFLATPISIIFNGLGDEVKSTNLSRIDLLKLWWEIKGINADRVNSVDLGSYTVEVIGPKDDKFRGIDRELMRSSVSKYFEDYRLTGKSLEVEITNASGEDGFGMLASEISDMAGFDVVRVSSTSGLFQKTQITASKESQEAKYLAKIFDCDIFWRQNGDDDSKTLLVIGQDFAKSYN